MPITGMGPAIAEDNFGLTFPCPLTITRLGFELVPVGETDYVPWNITGGGLSITCN